MRAERPHRSLDTSGTPGVLSSMRINIDTRRFFFIIGRANAFLFSLALALLLLFILSNYQQFLDVDQRLIMNLLAGTLILHLAVGLFYLLFPVMRKDATLFPRRRWLLILVATLVFSLLLLLVLVFFYAWISF
jgi:hypothetical protein